MGKTYSFKFLDNDLNQQLVSLLKKANIDHFIDKKGVIHYSAEDEEVVGNELICSIRDKVFSPWQVQTCPGDWTERYRDYMTRHAVPFTEELSNGRLWFLIPRRYRPFAWKLDHPTKKERPKSQTSV